MWLGRSRPFLELPLDLLLAPLESFDLASEILIALSTHWCRKPESRQN
jgi:hypothetical protein